MLVATGEALRFWGVSVIGREARSSQVMAVKALAVSGPFAYVRNPIYIGNMILYAGVGIMSMALFPWLQMGAIAWFGLQYALIVRGEEEYLSAQFGREYAQYCACVDRFIPHFGGHVQRAEVRPDLVGGISSERRTLQAITLVVVVFSLLFVTQHV